MKNIRFSWRTIILALLLIPLLVWAISYHPRQFKGGMGIRDSGFFSYPRYEAGLGRFPLAREGVHKFTVRWLPPESLDLILYVDAATEAQRPVLSSLTTLLSVSLTDASGRTLCAARGRLADARSANEYSWVLEISASHAGLWSSKCLNLPVSRFRRYTLEVAVSDVDTHSPNFVLTASLRGGGTELP